MANRNDLQAEFDKFDAAHPEIWQQFCETADMLIQRGLKHASATMVMEVINMRCAMETGHYLGVPNNHRGFYAKKWLETHKTPWRFFRMAASRAPKQPKQPKPQKAGPLKNPLALAIIKRQEDLFREQMKNNMVHHEPD